MSHSSCAMNATLWLAGTDYSAPIQASTHSLAEPQEPSPRQPPLRFHGGSQLTTGRNWQASHPMMPQPVIIRAAGQTHYDQQQPHPRVAAAATGGYQHPRVAASAAAGGYQLHSGQDYSGEGEFTASDSSHQRYELS